MKRRSIYGCLMFLMLLFMMPMRVCAAETGGIHILKTNVGGVPLPGAVFRIAREATKAELEDTQCRIDTLILNDRQINVVYESFYTDIRLEGETLQEARTDSSGKTAMYGLNHGAYYLVETHAPEGYNKITVPIKIFVNQYSHLTQEDGVRDDAGVVIDNTIHIINVRYQIPETGNSLALPLTMAGVAVVFSALALLLLNHKR